MENIAVIIFNEKQLKMRIIETRSGRFRVVNEIADKFDILKEIKDDCLLKPKTISNIVNVLKMYRKMIENFKVTKIIAVASDIILNSRNYRGFFEEIYTNTGINFVTLPEVEIIKNVYAAVVNSIDNSKGFIIDIDSHTTYFIRYNRRTILDSISIPYGSTNLTELNESMAKMCDKIKKEIKKIPFLDTIEEDSLYVGMGSAFVDLGKIAKKIERYPLDIDNNYVVSAETFDKVVSFVNTLDLEKVRKIKGISEEGPTNIQGGFAIIKAFMTFLNMTKVSIATFTIMDGLIQTNLSGLSQEKFTDLLSNSLDNYYEFVNDANSINSSVYSMALILFKQLKVVHKLPRAYSKPLRIAAYMYDCGRRINYENYEKCGFDVILNSNIVGASQKEILLGAFACECQNLDNLNLSDWLKYKDIVSEEDLDAVRKLGVLVRLAVALNVSRKNVINDIVCDILGDSIIMKTIVTGDPSFEILEGLKVSEDYKKVFKKNLQII